MRIDRSSDRAYVELAWWRERLEREDRQALRDSCAVLGLSGMRRFQGLNGGLLDQALGTNAKRRDNLLQKSADPATLHALLLCAHQRLHSACHWMDCAGEFVELHLLGQPSRDRIQQSLRALDEFQFGYPPFWPFDDGTDPLGEGLPQTDD